MCRYVLTVALIAWGCAGEPAPPTPTSPPESVGQLADTTDSQLQLEASSVEWPDGSFSMPEVIGGGVGLVDYDRDGDLDILQARFPPPGRPCEEGTGS